MPGSGRAGAGWVRWFGALLLALAGTFGAHAAGAEPPIPLRNLPPDLAPWVPWVLDGLGEERCPMLGDQRVCAWPGELALDVGDSGATFELGVVVDHESAVPLPGSAELWPQDVKAGATPVVVLGGDRPTVTLDRGAHELSGRFVWQATPESLPIPESIGIVSLRLRGQAVPQPRRDKADSVWLGRSETAAPEEPERVEVEVFRRLNDGVPFRIETRIVLRVSGRAREVSLGHPLLPGSRPLELSSGLPARLDDQGTLFVQVRAGEHAVALSALMPTPPSEIARPAVAAPWPDQEIWVWDPAPNLRQVQVSGLAGVDPARTNLPESWRNLSAYVATGQGRLVLNTVQRGQAQPPPNVVNLSREVWLDADGRAFTVRDTLGGTMNRDWRLDLATGELGRVRFGGGDQLITVGTAGHRGIEVREGHLAVEAEWRQPSPASAPFPAGGWSVDLESAELKLHLPPGWRLLGAWGVDEVSGGWLEAWNLFGLVYVLLVSLALGRLTRWYWGAIALLALVLSHEHEAAPYALWGLLVALLALLRVARQPLVRGVVGVTAGIGAVVLVAYAVPFVIAQLHSAAFPDFDVADGRYVTAHGGVFPAPVSAATREQQLLEMERVAEENADSKEGGTGTRAKGEEGSMGLPSAPGKRWAKGAPKQALQQQLDLDAVVQTGPGIPRWEGVTHRLGWHGPVRRDATLRLFVLAPWQSGLLALLRVSALLVLVAGVLVALSRARPRPEGAAGGGAATPARGAVAAALVLAALIAVLTSSRPAAAEIPSDAKLTELKERLTRQPDCGGACLSVANLALTVRGATVALDVEVHAGKSSAYKLPGPASSWVPARITVDGQPSRSLALRPDGYLHLRLEPGRHRIELEGPVAGNDLTLTLGESPRRVTIEADGWEVDGVRDGRVEGSLHLARKAVAAPAPGALDEPERARVALPPWLEIERRLEVGVTWKLRTTVKRISKAEEPLAIRYGLLPGEEVTESTLVAERGVVLLSLGRDQQELTFTSAIKPVESLVMTAAQGQPWSEIWTLECGAVWHCTTDGIAPEQHQDAGAWKPRFRPWPGERVTFAFARPTAAPGASTTIDRANVTVTPQSSVTAVTLEVRTSTGGMHSLEIPREAVVMDLTVGGRPQPIQVRDGKLSVVLEPGEQTVATSFRHGASTGPWLTTPEIRVGAAVNARTTIDVPERRFAVYTAGPGRGGVVLLWGAIALLVMAAVALSHLPYHPLRRWEWALLALGFPLVPWPATALVAAWFFLVGWRATWSGPATYRKNLVQALIVVTTLAAAVVVLAALHAGLVAAPDPLVAGADSGNHTIGFDVDRVLADAALPRPAVLTAPDWAWRLAHLAWAAWLGWLLLRVGRFAWAAFTRDGVLGPLLPPALVRLSAPVTRPAGTVALDEEDTVRVVADAAGLPEGEPPRAPAADPRRPE